MPIDRESHSRDLSSEEESAVRRAPLDHDARAEPHAELPVEDDAHELQEHEFTLEPEDFDGEVGPFEHTEHTAPWSTMPLPPLPPWATTARALLEPPTLPGLKTSVFYDDDPTPAFEPVAGVGLAVHALREELTIAKREASDRALRIELLERALADLNAAAAARQQRFETETAQQLGYARGVAMRVADLDRSLRALEATLQADQVARAEAEELARARQVALDDARRELAVAEQVTEERDKALRAVESRLAEAEERSRDHESMLAAARRELTETEAQAREADAGRAAAATRIEELEAQLQAAHAVGAARAAAEGRIQELETSQASAEQRMVELETSQASAEQRIGGLQASLASAEQRIQELESELQFAKASADELEDRLQLAKEGQLQAEARAERLERELRASTDATGSAVARIAELEHTLALVAHRATGPDEDSVEELPASDVAELEPTLDPTDATLELTARDLEEASEISIEVERLEAESPEAAEIYAEALGAESLEAAEAPREQPAPALEGVPTLESDVRQLKPKRRAARAAARRDDLTAIRGIGKRYAERLAEIGVTTYARIAAWTAADIERASAQVGIGAQRIQREGWVKQARKLHARADTARAKRSTGRAVRKRA